jgi:ABC-type nitrate/sulfonate/bicarbonate transport system ATPase subunit
LFSDLDFAVSAGSSLGILGPSGSGKSTLLKLISGKLKPQTGQVFFNGRPVIGVGRELTFEKDFLFSLDQGVNLPAYRMVRELFRIRLRQLPANEEKAVTVAVAANFGIETLLDQQTHTLSFGQAQRVGLALGACLPNQYIILDEPFSHQDPLNRQRLLFQLVCYGLAKSLTYIVASHSAEDCMILTDRCLYLNEGEDFMNFANWHEFFASAGSQDIKAYFEFLSGEALSFNQHSPNPKNTHSILKTVFLGNRVLEIGFDELGYPSYKTRTTPGFG